MLALIQKDLKEFTYGYVGIGSLILILILTYVFLWVFPQSSYLEFGFADASNYFRWLSYLLLFIVPLVAVQSITREYNQGTFELLRTRGISWGQIIISKFWALSIFVAIILACSLPHLFVINKLAIPHLASSNMQLFVSIVGTIAIGAIYAAISLAVTTIIEQGALAIIVSIIISFFLHTGISFMAEMGSISGSWSYNIQSWSLSWHMDQISMGLLPYWSIFYFLLLVNVALWTGNQILERRSF